MQTHTSDSIEISVMRTLCKRIRTDFAVKVGRSLDVNSKEYLSLDIDPSCYTDAALFSHDYLLYSFLRKWKGWNAGFDLDKTTLSGWTAAEAIDYRTNKAFDDTSCLPIGALRLISKIQRKIQNVIGASPCFDTIDPLCKWGPGATFDMRRGNTDASYKMSQTISITRRAVPHLLRVIDDVWWNGIRGDIFDIVKGNRCVMVPKNAKTHRMIAAEPTGNSFLQQGVGRYFRRRLKAFGVDLDDQTVNQELAFRCLVDGMSTLDLSMASDTLCLNLVHLLLPKAWCDYLCDIRSPYSYFDGKWYRLEKFSSMGNAFTFELESLIFWAVSSVVCDGRGSVSVYGDDIIVPRSCYDDVVAALKFCGFVVNQDKSFRDGPFFESCGKQYHSLEDVTPSYQKEVVGKQLSELIRMHNRLYRWGLRNDMRLVKDALSLIISYTQKMHPKLKKIPRTPIIEGDFGFLTDPSLLDVDVNGDFRCWVLEEISVVVYGIVPSEILCGYAYKLRHPAESNLLDTGEFGVWREQRTRLRKRVIWASSCKS